MKSQFEPICQEDCKEFNELFKRYKEKRIEDLWKFIREIDIDISKIEG